MFVTGLRCLRCGAEYPMDSTACLCPKCGPVRMVAPLGF